MSECDYIKELAKVERESQETVELHAMLLRDQTTLSPDQQHELSMLPDRIAALRDRRVFWQDVIRLQAQCPSRVATQVLETAQELLRGVRELLRRQDEVLKQMGSSGNAGAAQSGISHDLYSYL